MTRKQGAARPSNLATAPGKSAGREPKQQKVRSAAGTVTRKIAAQRPRSRRAPEQIEQAYWGLPTADRESVLHSLESERPADELDPTLWGRRPTPDEATAATLRGIARRYKARAAVINESLPVGQVAELLAVTPQAVQDRLKQGDLVGLKNGKDWRLPIWQFEPDTERGVVPGIRQLRKVFPGGVVSLTRWVTTENPDVDGRTPAEAMTDGDVGRVVRAAVSLTAVAW